VNGLALRRLISHHQGRRRGAHGVSCASARRLDMCCFLRRAGASCLVQIMFVCVCSLWPRKGTPCFCMPTHWSPNCHACVYPDVSSRPFACAFHPVPRSDNTRRTQEICLRSITTADRVLRKHWQAPVCRAFMKWQVATRAGWVRAVVAGGAQHCGLGRCRVLPLGLTLSPHHAFLSPCACEDGCRLRPQGQLQAQANALQQTRVAPRRAQLCLPALNEYLRSYRGSLNANMMWWLNFGPHVTKK